MWWEIEKLQTKKYCPCFICTNFMTNDFVCPNRKLSELDIWKTGKAECRWWQFYTVGCSEEVGLSSLQTYCCTVRGAQLQSNYISHYFSESLLHCKRWCTLLFLVSRCNWQDLVSESLPSFIIMIYSTYIPVLIVEYNTSSVHSYVS